MTHVHTTDCLPSLRKQKDQLGEKFREDLIDINNQIEQAESNPAYDPPLEPQRNPCHPTVVTFTKTFNSYRIYTYVALRKANRTTWRISGDAKSREVRWDGLVDFLVLDERKPQDAINSMRLMKTNGKPMPLKSSLEPAKVGVKSTYDPSSDH